MRFYKRPGFLHLCLFPLWAHGCSASYPGFHDPLWLATVPVVRLPFLIRSPTCTGSDPESHPSTSLPPEYDLSSVGDWRIVYPMHIVAGSGRSPMVLLDWIFVLHRQTLHCHIWCPMTGETSRSFPTRHLRPRQSRYPDPPVPNSQATHRRCSHQAA